MHSRCQNLCKNKTCLRRYIIKAKDCLPLHKFWGKIRETLSIGLKSFDKNHKHYCNIENSALVLCNKIYSLI